MTEDNGKKLTLSAKSTLTLKKTGLSATGEGRKVVQVEVRKKRFVAQKPEAKASVEIDEALAQKLELLA
ncbi:MAG: IF-2-associated domain-containing protein, partial [Alphaproteobacteria bacterium]|nr:IF-2-associated domain-containing protein [Alphaproteobacteria bacterium]